MSSTKGKNEFIIWGGTGNAKVVNEIIELRGKKVVAIFDNNKERTTPLKQVPIYYEQQGFLNWLSENGHEYEFIVAIGGGYGKDRCNIHEFLKSCKLKPAIITHPSAQISESSAIGEGTQIFMNVSISVEAQIGKACVINTSASIDHECELGDGVFVGPGARLAGLVNVGNYADIYTGAIILPRIRIGEFAVIGAGAVVLEDVPHNAVVVGNPGRIIRYRDKNND